MTVPQVLGVPTRMMLTVQYSTAVRLTSESMEDWKSYSEYLILLQMGLH